MADYKSICGLEDDGSEELNKNNKLSDGSTKIANDFIRRYVLGNFIFFFLIFFLIFFFF